METRREFVVRLQTTVAGVDGLKALCATLNFARGRFGLRAIDACEVLPAAAGPARLAVESLAESPPSS